MGCFRSGGRHRILSNRLSSATRTGAPAICLRRWALVRFVRSIRVQQALRITGRLVTSGGVVSVALVFFGNSPLTRGYGQCVDYANQAKSGNLAKTMRYLCHSYWYPPSSLSASCTKGLWKLFDSFYNLSDEQMRAQALSPESLIPRIVHFAGSMVVFLRTYLSSDTLDPAFGTRSEQSNPPSLEEWG